MKRELVPTIKDIKMFYGGRLYFASFPSVLSREDHSVFPHLFSQKMKELIPDLTVEEKQQIKILQRKINQDVINFHNSGKFQIFERLMPISINTMLGKLLPVPQDFKARPEVKLPY